MNLQAGELQLVSQYVLVLDEDARQFSILGPMADTSYLRGQVAKARGKGRKLTLAAAQGNDAVTISKLVKSTGFDYTVAQLL